LSAMPPEWCPPSGRNTVRHGPERAVRSSMAWRVPFQSKLDLGIDFTKFAPDLKVSTSFLPILSGYSHQFLEESRNSWACVRILLPQFLISDLLIDPMPADPFAVVPNPLGGIL